MELELITEGRAFCIVDKNGRVLVEVAAFARLPANSLPADPRNEVATLASAFLVARLHINPHIVYSTSLHACIPDSLSGSRFGSGEEEGHGTQSRRNAKGVQAAAAVVARTLVCFRGDAVSLCRRFRSCARRFWLGVASLLTAAHMLALLSALAL
eukprot:418792-Pleurochrysis_carterae.AAC.2